MNSIPNIQRRYVLLIYGWLLVIIAAGCGSGSDAPGPPETTGNMAENPARAETLFAAGRFAAADSLLQQAESAGDTGAAVHDLQMMNLAAWAEKSAATGDSATMARCLLRLAARPLPDSIMLAIGPLAEIAYHARALTDNIVADYAPRFTADGRKMVYFSRLEREGLEFLSKTYAVRYQTQICLLDPASGVVEIISDGRASEFFPDISPDGRFVVCQRADGDTLKGEWTAAAHSYLYLYDLADGSGRPLGSDTIFAQCPRFCSGGNEVIFITYADGPEGVITSLNLADETLTPRYLYETLIHSPKPGGVFCPTFLADQRRMVFQAGILDHKGLYVADEFGRKMVRLSPNRTEWHHDTREWHPAVSPDGMWVVFIAEVDDGEELFIRAVAGGGRRQLTFDGYRKMFPAYSPDGKYLAYGARPPGEDDADYEIYLLQLAAEEYREDIGRSARATLQRAQRLFQP
jgi:Tol biopolymer transport system component